MADNETIADIIAWLRKPREGENAYLTLWRDEIADRLEAAHKREVRKAVTDCNQFGDAAKLREALKLCLRGMCGYCRMDAEARGMTTECVNGCEALLMAKAALAAPPRNCDVGTEGEQDERFNYYCLKYIGDSCSRCPLSTRKECVVAWMQMPYEEGGGK